jgi:hypothetical protein
MAGAGAPREEKGYLYIGVFLVSYSRAGEPRSPDGDERTQENLIREKKSCLIPYLCIISLTRGKPNRIGGMG